MQQTVEQRLTAFEAWLRDTSHAHFGENVVVTRAVAAGLHETAPETCAQMVGFGHWLKESMATELAIHGAQK